MSVAVDLRAPPGPEAVDRAIARFADRMKERYRAKLTGVYLFGSRARGDGEPFSDVDIAVVVDDPDAHLSDVADLSAIAYDLFLETGAEIQPWTFRACDWGDPACSASPRLVEAARRDAKAIWSPHADLS